MRKTALSITILSIGLYLMSTCVTSENIITSREQSSNESGWTPPHIETHKIASPSVTYKKDTPGMTDATWITLTVSAVGDPVPVKYPVDVVLTIDTTDSMNDNYNGKAKLIWAKESAINFIKELNLNGTDRVALIQFASGVSPPVKVVQGFTNNSVDIINSINSLACSGSTNLYDATAFASDYANKNHWPNNQTHPHPDLPINHHKPVVIVMTDGFSNADSSYDLISCEEFIRNSHYSPPPSNYKGFQTVLYTIGLGTNVEEMGLRAMAQASEGMYFFAPTPDDLDDIYDTISKQYISSSANAAIQDSSDWMITDVLPPYLQYVVGSYITTANNNVNISGFIIKTGLGATNELKWNVTIMKLNDVFEVMYRVKSILLGWQSIGVTKFNATNEYGSEYCHVTYRNYNYNNTNSPTDVWINETMDYSILVLEKGVPEDFYCIPFIALFTIIIVNKKTKKRGG